MDNNNSSTGRKEAKSKKYYKNEEKEHKKMANRESHRYDHLPLLRSGPGGFSRSW